MPLSLRDQINKRSAFASPEEEAMLNIARTAGMVGGAERAFFKRFDLSPQAYNLLRILRGHQARGLSEGVRASEIGCQMVVRMPDVTRLVDRLESRGLVERSSCAQDKRVKFVCLSAAGELLLSQIDPEIGALGQSVLGHLSKGELEQLSLLLEKARNEARGVGGGS